MKAVLLGSIGVFCDSSDLQRQAYNAAFKEAELDWHWGRDLYEKLLLVPGGADRVRDFAKQRGIDAVPDSAMIHERKAQIYAQMLNTQEQTLRKGVLRLIREAQTQGVKVGWVTSTDYSNLVAIMDRSEGQLSASDFDVITHRGNVESGKPDPAPYLSALSALGLKSDDAIAIEDTGACVSSATGAGLTCVATPHEYSLGHDFSTAVSVVDSLGEPGFAASGLAGTRILDEQGMVTVKALKQLIDDKVASSA